MVLLQLSYDGDSISFTIQYHTCLQRFWRDSKLRRCNADDDVEFVVIVIVVVVVVVVA